MAPRNPRGVGSLLKLPERLDPPMYTFRASEHFTTDAQVRNVPFGDNGSRDGHGPLYVLRGFPAPPPLFLIAHVSGGDPPGVAFQPSHAAGIRMVPLLMR